MKKSYKKRKDYSFSKPAEPVRDINKLIFIPEVITVKELSEKTGIPAVGIISELMKNGVLAAINESIDYDTAAIVCDYLGVKCESAEKSEETKTSTSGKTQIDVKNLIERPPVVTIMGHVDHGKTTLLDRVRLAHVVDTESGGITQHISAYQVNVKKSDKKSGTKLITFIDTPGHAAFSALRTHGASITDVVVLIVAANDGIMPQTIEVIEQCKISNVPIIVAINKIDLPDADPMKVKQQLADYDLVPEEWGGKTLMVEISAKTGLGVDKLLEVILVQAEMMDLKADPQQKAFGVVIESHMHKGAGPLAIVLVENGSLKKGDAVQVGQTWGRVRILEDFNKQPIEIAGPSSPVRIAGLKDMPSFGDHLISFDSEKEAKEASQKTHKPTTVKIATAKKLSENEESDKERASKELKIVVKTDVKGSLEAIKKLISDIDTLELSIKIVGEGIGAISESDVTLAKAAHAVVYAFRVPVMVSAKKISEKEKVKLKSYDIIYELLTDIKNELTSMLPTVYEEETIAQGKVLALFRNDKKSLVVGALLDSGKISIGEQVRFYDNSEVSCETKVFSLRREKDQVNEVSAGTEFGLAIEPGTKVTDKMTFEVYKKNEVNRQIK